MIESAPLFVVYVASALALLFAAGVVIECAFAPRRPPPWTLALIPVGPVWWLAGQGAFS